jgi:hypothetical protein
MKGIKASLNVAVAFGIAAQAWIGSKLGGLSVPGERFYVDPDAERRYTDKTNINPTREASMAKVELKKIGKVYEGNVRAVSDANITTRTRNSWFS